MTTDNKSRTASGGSFLEGKLLIALPGMNDPRFDRSVIYMCAHSPTGAMGIIINKPVEGLGFQDVLRRLNLPIGQKLKDFSILFGGPVETGRGFVLHTGEYETSEGTLAISNGIFLTATVDILRAIAEGDGPRKAVFALGYAGWGPGQVETEIQSNGWVHCDADAALIFDDDMNAKWSTALRKLGVDLSGLTAHAGHA